MTYPHRYVCSALEEMRAMHKTRNYGGLLGLIEEVQSLANRMEAALDQQRDYFKLRDNCKELEKRRDELKKEIEELEDKSSDD